MRNSPSWRSACVVRAQTIAANLRMIEFAVEGGLAAFGQGARTRVLVPGPAVASISSHVCVHVGQGRMRVLVADAECGRGERFMWSLIEGARVRLTTPAAPAIRCRKEPRIACAAAVALAFGGRRAHGAARPSVAANGNAAAHRVTGWRRI